MPWEAWTQGPHASYDAQRLGYMAGWPPRVGEPPPPYAQYPVPPLPPAQRIDPEPEGSWMPMALFGIGLVAGLLIGRAVTL